MQNLSVERTQELNTESTKTEIELLSLNRNVSTKNLRSKWLKIKLKTKLDSKESYLLKEKNTKTKEDKYLKQAEKGSVLYLNRELTLKQSKCVKYLKILRE